MGYRSTVHLAVAFGSRQNMKEILSVYAMHPFVQKHKLLDEWEEKEDNILYLHQDYVKWYDSYEDVQGFEHLFKLVEQFYDERALPYAWRSIRLGEDIGDVEVRDNYGDDQTSTELIDLLWDNMQVEVNVDVSL